MPYDVRYRDVATETETLVEDVATEQLDVTGLTAGTDYEFQVREITGTGSTSLWSSWTAFSTTTYVDVAATPTATLAPLGEATEALSAQGSASAMLVTTGDAEVDAITFTLEYRETGGATTQVTSISDTQYDLTELTPNTGYEWRLRTVRSDGAQTAFTEWQAFTTAVAYVDVASDATSDLSTTGDALAGVVDRYNVEYRDADTQTTTSVTGITDLFLDITGLDPATTYEYRVQWAAGGDTGGWSAWSEFNTVGDEPAASDVLGSLSVVALATADKPATADVAAATLSTTAVNIATKDLEANPAASLTITAQPAADRKTGGSTSSQLTAGNVGFEISSEGASFTNSALFSVGQASATRTGQGAASATSSATADVVQELIADGSATAGLSTTGEATRTFSVASFQGSSLVAQGAATEPVLAAGTATAAAVGAADPEVDRGVIGQSTTTAIAVGDAAIGRSVVGQATATLSQTGDGFIDRGFEVAGDVSSSLSSAGTPAYDAVIVGQATATVAADAQWAVTKSARATSVADLFQTAVPARDIEVSATTAAQGSGSGAVEAGVVVRAEASSTAALSTAGQYALSISFLAAGGATLLVQGQGATNQEGAGTTAAQLRTAAETIGGTPVAPGALSVDKVSIFPSMSCYTKVVPSMYANVILRSE